jgi:hypothetical protein
VPDGVMDFECDAAKAAANLRKHNVDFPKATRVFLDPNVYEMEDEFVRFEWRSRAVGMVDDSMITVIYTMRENTIRIISARKASPHEKRKYHEI